MTAIPPDENEEADLPPWCRFALGCFGIVIAAAGLLWAQLNRDLEETAIEPYLQATALFAFGCGALVLAWLSKRKL